MSEDMPRARPPRRVRIPGIAIAALVLLVLAVGGLAPALTTYLDQRQQIADTAARIAQQKAELRDLDAQVARWDDPAYVRAQAASRLFYVVPGTTAYRLIHGSAAATAADAAPAATATEERTPWTQSLLDSFVAAGTTTATPQQLRSSR
jgi:cell division protein FtsB